MQIDGNYIEEYRSGIRLVQIDGNYINECPSCKRIWQIDGKYVKECCSGKRLYEFNGSANMSPEYLFAVLYARTMLNTLNQFVQDFADLAGLHY